MPVIGSLMRGTDRLLDVLHGVYERLIHWIFSPRRWRVRVPPLPVWGHPFGADGRRDRQAPRRWRLATITPRAVVVLTGIGSFAAALALAPLVGTEFIPDSDNSYIQLNVTLPVGTSLARGSEKMRQVEDAITAMPEIRAISTTIGDTGSGSRNSAVLSAQLVKPGERKRSQRDVEKAIREAVRTIPGIEVTLGNRPIYVALLGPDPEVLETEVLRLADKVAKVRGIADLTTSVQPGLPAYAVRLKPDAVRELGLTTMQLASSLRTFVNGDVATYWTSPDGEQVDVELRLPQSSRENVAQLNDLPVAYAKDGTPIALASVAEIVPVVNPVVIKRQDLQRRQAIYAGTEGPAERRRRRRRAEDRQGDGSCRPATASTSAARRATRRRRSSASCSRSPRR